VTFENQTTEHKKEDGGQELNWRLTLRNQNHQGDSHGDKTAHSGSGESASNNRNNYGGNEAEGQIRYVQRARRS
jgi:hypothetical protein